MARVVSVSEVRNQLYWAAGGPRSSGDGAAALPLLGTLFHQAFAGLTGDDERVNLVRPLERADANLESWRRELVAHAYAWHVAPRLEAHQAELQGEGEAVESYWEGVRQLSRWLAELLWEQRAAGRGLAEARRAVFAGSEEEINVVLDDPSWSAPVNVVGRADALLRQPESGMLCALELKTGRTAPEADACQAALYRRLLKSDDVALLSFRPEPHEQRFRSDQLVDAEAKLMALIGALAGVSGAREEAAAVTPAPDRVATGQRIVEVLAECGVGVKLDGAPLTGPAFVRYFLEPDRGVRPDRIQQLDTMLWTRLKTEQPPQISIARGRVVVDVERPDRETVYWRDLRPQLAQPTRQGTARFPVGVRIDGTLQWADFAEPHDSHMLVAGTAGSGKSEWLRAAIASLLAQNTPDTLQLLLIDPKRTAFHAFEESKFLWAPVLYPDDTDVTEVFSKLIDEMERRYKSLSDARVADLAAYAAARKGAPPRIVCFCDEYADLVLGDVKRRKEIERLMGRLAAKGRAGGVHLVFATQRPSRDVVSGVIDTNLMARVCLRVGKPAESRIVLGDDSGGSSLLGRGDLLFKDLGSPIRLQSPFIEEKELEALL